jgi:hypothetical protein
MEEKKAATATPVSSTSAGGNTVVSPSEAEAIVAAFASNKKIDEKQTKTKNQRKK